MEFFHARIIFGARIDEADGRVEGLYLLLEFHERFGIGLIKFFVLDSVCIQSELGVGRLGEGDTKGVSLTDECLEVVVFGDIRWSSSVVVDVGGNNDGFG